MKVECPVCHVEGILQQRGNSERIQHYLGYRDGKRVYHDHKLEVNGSNNGSKLLEVNNQNLASVKGIVGGPSRTRTGDLWLVKPTS